MSSDATSVLLDWTEASNRHDPDAYARYLGDDWGNLRHSCDRWALFRGPRDESPLRSSTDPGVLSLSESDCSTAHAADASLP